MNIEEGKERGVYSGNSHQPGFANYPTHEPVIIGYPQPFALQNSSAPPPPPQSYAHGHQADSGYPVSVVHVQDVQVYVKGNDAFPCCGIGIGWLLFILGFFLGVIPWYIGAIMLCFKDKDKREKHGLIACAITAVISTILIIVAVVMIIHNNNNSSYVDPYN